MLIYELEIGFKSNNILQISVECVDEADAKDTFVGLINDLTMTDSGGYLLEHDRGLATFSVKDVEYITWKQILDTHKETLRNEAMRRNGLSWNGGFTIPKEFVDDQLDIRE